jgi:hypothetical protein
MIRIRRSALPPGLFARAEAQGRSTVIYLLPGLPAADRRAALLRLRRNGRLGYGPALPPPASRSRSCSTGSRRSAGPARRHCGHTRSGCFRPPSSP